MATAPERRSPCYFDDQGSAVAFDKAFLQLLAATQKKVTSKYLPPENTHRIRHGGKWLHPGLPQVSEGGLQQHSSIVTIPFEDLVGHDLDAIERCTHKLAADMEEQFVRMMYSTISAACEQTGNTVDAKAAGSIPEAFAEMLEKVQFGTGKDGTVRLPEIHMGSEAFTAFTKAMDTIPAAFHQRIEEIKERKTLEALDREAKRKARFVRYGNDE